MINILEFSRLFYPSEIQNHEVLDLNRIDIEKEYSVLTKTLEQTFQFFNEDHENETYFFKNLYHEEKVGLSIYLSFIHLIYNFIEKRKEKIISSTFEKEDPKEEVFVKSFLQEKKGLNLLRNLQDYQKMEHVESFVQEMNQSIFFQILFGKGEQTTTSDWSFETCFLYLIRYLFASELYRMVQMEIKKCKRMYGDNFFLHLPEIHETNFFYSLTEYVAEIERTFLKKCEYGIYNIEYAHDPTIFCFDYCLYHLDHREVRSNLNRKINVSKLFDRKLNYYIEKMEPDLKMWQKFKKYFEDWEINLVYKIMKKYPVHELTVSTIVSFYRNFFSISVMKSILVKHQEKRIVRHVRENTNKRDLFFRNFFPKDFTNFRLGDRNSNEHLIFQKLLNCFPLGRFNFHKMNLQLWYLMNVVELYRYYKYRNIETIESFHGASCIQFPEKISSDPQKISIGSFMKILREHYGFTKSKRSFLDEFTDLFKEVFQAFFRENLKKKFALLSVRKEYILQNCQWSSSINNNRIYKYFCDNNLDLFDKVVAKEHETMKKNWIEGYEVFSEKWKSCLLYFHQNLSPQENIKEDFLFVVELLTGMKMTIVNKTDHPNELVSLILKEFDYILQNDKSMIYKIGIDDSLFYKKEYLKRNFSLFVSFLKNVELVFFPIEEKKTQLEEVIDIRMKMLLCKDIYALLE